jgi:adenylate cyclase
VKLVGRELGVRYVLEGSLRKFGNRIRVTAQLVEAEAGHHVWAEHYDRDLADIFALQDEITRTVTVAIAPAIAYAEQPRALRKPPGSLDAWAAYQRGLWHVGKFSAADNALAQKFFQQAIDLDPNFAGGYGALAIAQLQSAGVFHKHTLTEVQSTAEIAARKAVALDGADAESRVSLAFALLTGGDCEGALIESGRALAISPNLASAHGQLGQVLIYTGRPKEGQEALETCIRLDPCGPWVAIRLLQMAIGFYFLREYESSVETLKRVIRSYPDFPSSLRWLVAGLGQVGHPEEAKEALGKAIAIAPGSFEMYVRKRVPWHRPEDHAHFLEGLRKAGWRET